jgi:hypothetical protein
MYMVSWDCLEHSLIPREVRKTSSQAKKYEKLLDDDKFYFIIQEELRPEASKMAMSINNAKDIPQQKRRKEAEKPLYLMRYE